VFERVLVVALGAVFLLVGLELALRILGAVYDLRHHHAENGAAGASTVILAMGDSMTYGVGASPGGDYPAQLQRRLNGGTGAGPFRVVNGGVGGANSAILRERLPRVLDEIQPDLVILMAGTANHTNYIGYRRVGSLSSTLDRLAVVLQTSRVVRFGRIAFNTLETRRHAEVEPIYDGTSADVSAFLRWQARRPGGPPTWLDDPALVEGARLLEYGHYPEAEALFRARTEADPNAAWALWGLGTALTALREFPESRAAFERCTALAPEEPACPYGIGVILLYTREEGTEGPRARFQQAADLAPDFSGAWWGLAMALRSQGGNQPAPATEASLDAFLACMEADPEDARCYPNLMGATMGASEETKRRVEAALQAAARHSTAARGSLEAMRGELDQRLITAWVEADLDAMVAMIQARGVPVLLHDYPRRSPVNESLARVAARHGVPFVDHEAVFRHDAVGPRAAQYFAADGGHCSDLGYGLMVDGLMAALRTHPELLDPAGRVALQALPEPGRERTPPPPNPDLPPPPGRPKAP
jgi:lysophospholipase L1-like esterase